MKVQQQGEVYIERIDTLPGGLTAFEETNGNGAYIISHSEKGHHHVIDCADAEVMGDTRSGMDILYAVVKTRTSMYQTASVAHDKAPMTPGNYKLTISREYDPFAEQVRRVAD